MERMLNELKALDSTLTRVIMNMVIAVCVTIMQHSQVETPFIEI